MKNIWKFDQKKVKKLTKHIKTYLTELKKVRKKIIIEIKSNNMRNTWKIMKEKIGKKEI